MHTCNSYTAIFFSERTVESFSLAEKFLIERADIEPPATLKQFIMCVNFDNSFPRLLKIDGTCICIDTMVRGGAERT